MKYAERCLELAKELSQFFIACGHEAIARAALIIGDRERCMEHLAVAKTIADGLHDDEERRMIDPDSKWLESQQD